MLHGTLTIHRYCTAPSVSSFDDSDRLGVCSYCACNAPGCWGSKPLPSSTKITNTPEFRFIFLVYLFLVRMNKCPFTSDGASTTDYGNDSPKSSLVNSKYWGCLQEAQRQPHPEKGLPRPWVRTPESLESFLTPQLRQPPLPLLSFAAYITLWPRLENLVIFEVSRTSYIS